MSDLDERLCDPLRQHTAGHSYTDADIKGGPVSSLSAGASSRWSPECKASALQAALSTSKRNTHRYRMRAAACQVHLVAAHLRCNRVSSSPQANTILRHVKAFLQELSLASLQKTCAILACFSYNRALVQMRPSLPNPPSAPPPDSATAHLSPAASAIMPQLPQHAASSGPSAVQMTSQRHHAHITHTVTAVLPSDDSHVNVVQAPVPQRRGHKRRALSTVAASQITRRVRQRSGLSHASSHVDHQPRPSSAVPRAVASVVCSMSSDVTPSLIGGPSALGAPFDPGG